MITYIFTSFRSVFSRCTFGCNLNTESALHIWTLQFFSVLRGKTAQTLSGCLEMGSEQLTPIAGTWVISISLIVTLLASIGRTTIDLDQSL